MLDISKDIHSLTDFKTKTPEFLAQLRGTDRALLLTVNGRAEVAVMSAATFQRVLDALAALDAIRGIKAGLDDMESGRIRSADEFLDEFRKRRGLPKTGS